MGVLFPVGMPDEGVFEWADQFLAKNPSYTEISDRKIIEWAQKSNIERPQPNKASVDSPDMNFGIPLLDDLSVRKLLEVIAPTLDRNFLVMELKNNIVSETRQAAIARFSDFKKVAEAEQKKKEKEEARKKLFEEKKRKAEEARKAKLAARKAAEAKKGGEEEEAKVEEEVKEQVK